MIVSDGSLAHYGVIGMRWGVRKARSRGSRSKSIRSVSSKLKKTYDASLSEDARAAAGLKLRKRVLGTKNLSNEELKTLITRRQLERQLNDINRQDISKGRKFAEKSLEHVGTMVVTTVSIAVIKPYIEKLITEIVTNRA